MAVIGHYSQNGPLDAIDWYVTCLRDVIARKPVRGLDEAEAGYARAVAQLEGGVEAAGAYRVALNSIAFSDNEHPAPDVMALRDRAFHALGGQ